MPIRKIIACYDKTTKNSDREETLFNCLEGSAFVVASALNERLPCANFVHVDTTKDLQYFWSYGLKIRLGSQQFTCRQLFYDIEQNSKYSVEMR